MYQDLYCYVDIDCEQYIENPHYFKELYETVGLAYQHKITVFYNKKQVDNLKSYYSKDEDDWNKNFTHSHGFNLRNLLKKAKEKTICNYCFQICFAAENTTLNLIKNEAVSIISDSENIALISSSYCESSFLLFVKSEAEFNKINFKIIKNKNELLNWVQQLKQRKFNFSDKHGKNGKGNWKGESALLCNEEQAQMLLNTAIADFNAKNSGKNLYNFDKKYATFIEFYYEGDNPQNQWHGFHVEEYQWDRVPDSVKKYFNKK
jgi:hypothetical protein